MNLKDIRSMIEHYMLVILGVFLATAIVVPWWIGFVTILRMIWK